MEVDPNDPLELEVTNFGPIVSGQIDLRPLTVFVGPSNTGKSYLAVLIYALHRFFAPTMSRLMTDPLPLALEGKAPKSTIEAAWTWATDIFGEHGKPLAERIGKPLTVPPTISGAIRSLLGRQGDALSGEVSRCFGANPRDLIRKGTRKGANVVVRKRAGDSFAPKFEHQLSLTPPSFQSVFVDELTVTPNDDLRQYHYFREMTRTRRMRTDRFEREIWYWSFLDSLTNLALPDLVGALHRPAYYLPADRTGVMHAHNVVVSALIESAAMTGLRPAARMPTLSGVLADFLEQLIQLDSRPYRRKKRLAFHAGEIEETILHGAVLKERGESSGYPRFAYRPEGWKGSLPLMSASSMVSELAPVVLFLRHLVAPGDLLIIEEPESHLHPAMQVELTRQIASLVRSGIRVLVTTHSEWVLEELSNIVLASTVPKTGKKRTAGKGVALNESQVGVWAFNPKMRPKGTVVEEIKLKASGDLYSASFDDVSAETYNKWVTLGNLAGSDA